MLVFKHTIILTMWILCIMPSNYVGEIVSYATTIIRVFPIRSKTLFPPGNRENPPHSRICIL